MLLKIVHTTDEQIMVPLTEFAGDVDDPTTLPVELAVTYTDATPGEDDFVTAAWITVAGVVYAQARWPLLRPDAAPHTKYATYLRVTSDPEVPVLYAGVIQTR